MAGSCPNRQECAAYFTVLEGAKKVSYHLPQSRPITSHIEANARRINEKGNLEQSIRNSGNHCLSKSRPQNKIWTGRLVDHSLTAFTEWERCEGKSITCV
jgi:hypothetical protein